MLDNMSKSKDAQETSMVCLFFREKGNNQEVGVRSMLATFIYGQHTSGQNMSPSLLSASWGKLSTSLAQFLHL